MANEITVNASLSVNKSPLKVDQNLVQGKFTLAGDAYSAGVQAIMADGHERLDISADMGTAGWAWFKNLGDTDIEIGVAVDLADDFLESSSSSVSSISDVSTAFVPLIRLAAGEFAVLPLATLDVYAKAITSASLLEFRVLER